MAFPLETERLIIRAFCETDLEEFFAYRNDPEVAKYQGWPVPYSMENAVNFIREMKNVKLGAAGAKCQVAIELKENRRLIGDIGFIVSQKNPGQARIGYSLACAYWKNGYASEAVACMLDYFFNELSLHRVSADCDPENIASSHLLEKLGFRREGHFIESFWLGDKWGDEYYYGILQREWIK